MYVMCSSVSIYIKVEECLIQENLDCDGKLEHWNTGTFRPNVNKHEKKPKEKKGPIVVRGLGRFMELKNLAKKKEEDKKQREREVFGMARKDFRRT